MSKLPSESRVSRFFWRLDSYVSSGAFELIDWLKRRGSAYSSFLYRFRISGARRAAIDILDDAATFGTIAAFGLLAFALPPFSGTGDIWNKGREYAITFTDQNGEIIGRRGIRQDDAIPLEEIPPVVVNAALATEDARFYQHFGVDVWGTFRAMLQNARANEVVQGGSSITQQVAKNLFLSPERTIQRKVHEAFLALWIEARLSKDEILKLYLDRSYLGGGTYGVEAAAQYYFGKSIRDVTLSEAAMLGGLFKAPSKYAPHVDLASARARANVVLYRMLDTGFITQGELIEARRQPAELVVNTARESPDWFLDKAYADTLELIEKKRITSDFVLEVKTTIDQKIQQAAQRAVNESIEANGVEFRATQAAVVTMDPDGAIRAVVGGRNYEESQFNRATDALRQPGSSFKPFVYLTALLNGFTPDTMVTDSPVSIGNWTPRNYSGKYAGRVTLTKALAQSFNSVPVHLMLKFGRKAIIDTAHRVGVQGELQNVWSLPLGSSAMTLLDLTTGYATFAAGGLVTKPYTVLEIKRPNGDVIYARDKEPEPRERGVPEEKIVELNTMLNEVVVNGTGKRAFLGFTPQAGKTGTNQGYRDAWFIGFTAHYVTGVWFGNDDFSEMNKVTGGLLPAAAWKEVMLAAEETQTAAGLPGVPLDESYARWVAENQPPLEIAAAPPDTVAQPGQEPGTVAQPGQAPGTTRQTSASASVAGVQKITPPPKKVAATRVALTGEEDVVVIRRREPDDPVFGVLKDMFGLFRPGDDEAPRQRVREKRRTGILVLPGANTGKRKLRTGSGNR